MYLYHKLVEISTISLNDRPQKTKNNSSAKLLAKELKHLNTKGVMELNIEFSNGLETFLKVLNIISHRRNAN